MGYHLSDLPSSFCLHGYKPNHHGGPYSARERREALALYQEKGTMAVVRELGINSDTLLKWRAEAGVPANPRKSWTREKILDTIREWVRRYGEPPTHSDWTDNPGWPSPTTVRYHCNCSFNQAIAEAGFERRRRGGAHAKK